MSQPFEQDGAQPLHFAAKAGHVQAVRFLLSRGAQLEATSPKEGFTPLHFAAAMGHAEVARLLIKKGGRQSMGKRDRRGLLPIHLAIRAGSSSLVQDLMKHGIPSDLVHFAAEGGRTEVIRKVLQTKPDLGNTLDARGFRPLHMAALAGHLDVLGLLVGEGFPIGATDTQGFTAVHFAAKSGHRAAVQYLATMRADLKMRSKDCPSLHGCDCTKAWHCSSTFFLTGTYL